LTIKVQVWYYPNNFK